jgi:hypothetical protein
MDLAASECTAAPRIAPEAPEFGHACGVLLVIYKKCGALYNFFVNFYGANYYFWLRSLQDTYRFRAFSAPEHPSSPFL